ncbi:MAG: hypothetical protein JWM95_3217 [Gemmatimonadetes bacterium]|nr:hypothetical protein [Gemmatimonadota bacterium]
MSTLQRLTPSLWFDSQAEQAAQFYTGIFKNSRIVTINYYGKAGFETHRRPAGSVMSVLFELDGHEFTAVNGGPQFKFTEAISFQVNCEEQHEIDYYWDRLSSGGDPRAQQCGWLKDKYGLSWQIVPSMLPDLFRDASSDGAARAMTAMLKMKKLDIETLEKAFEG